MRTLLGKEMQNHPKKTSKTWLRIIFSLTLYNWQIILTLCLDLSGITPIPWFTGFVIYTIDILIVYICNRQPHSNNWLKHSFTSQTVSDDWYQWESNNLLGCNRLYESTELSISTVNSISFLITLQYFDLKKVVS